MNLKSIVMVASAVTAGFSMAAEYSSGVKLCQVEVANSTPDAVISVPVLGMTTDAVNPASLVMTTGLGTGDYMYANVGGNRKAWSIDNNGTWVGTQIAAGDNVVGELIPAAGESDAIARGDSIWLHRQSASGSIYLWGRVATNAYDMATAAGFTMIGNPTLTEYSLLEIPWGTTKPAAGDQIMTIDGTKATGVGATYTCSATGETITWVVKAKNEQGKLVKTTLTAETAPKFGPGEGFYYKATGTAPAINWPAPAAN